MGGARSAPELGTKTSNFVFPSACPSMAFFCEQRGARHPTGCASEENTPKI